MDFVKRIGCDAIFSTTFMKWFFMEGNLVETTIGYKEPDLARIVYIYIYNGLF